MFLVDGEISKVDHDGFRVYIINSSIKFSENLEELKSIQVYDNFTNSQAYRGLEDNVGRDKAISELNLSKLSNDQKWYEKSWVQIIFILSAIATIVGLFL